MSLLLIYCTVIANAESFDLFSKIVRLTVILGAFLALWAVLSHTAAASTNAKNLTQCFARLPGHNQMMFSWLVSFNYLDCYIHTMRFRQALGDRA